MKKTLIAMFALAGLAMADSDLTTTWTLYSSPASETTDADNAYGLIFDLAVGTGNRKAVSSETATATDYAAVESFTLQNIKIVTGAESVSCNFVLMGPLSGNNINDKLVTGNLLGFISQDAVDVNLGTATLDFSSQGITLTPGSSYRLYCTTKDWSETTLGTSITHADDDKTYFSMKGYTSGGNSNQREHLGFIGSGLGVGLRQSWVPMVTMTLTSTSVPEPATATLSLLALAGLAARRRRH